MQSLKRICSIHHENRVLLHALGRRVVNIRQAFHEMQNGKAAKVHFAKPQKRIKERQLAAGNCCMRGIMTLSAPIVRMLASITMRSSICQSVLLDYQEYEAYFKQT